MPAIVIGTAQWGLSYGVTNEQGRLSDSSVDAIVSTARDLGIASLDTAAGYGDAEERIRSAAADFAVATKANGRDEMPVEGQIERSLARLGRPRLDRCLLHDWSVLADAEREQAVSGLRRARDLGLVDEIGISVYTEDDLHRAIQYADDLSVVQLPASVLDQRLEGSDAVDVLRSRGWTVQARSVLLQGVLAAPMSTAFASHPDVVRVAARAARANCSLMDLALGYVATRPWVDEIVVGVTSAVELQEVAAAIARPVAAEDWQELASSDRGLIDPRGW